MVNEKWVNYWWSMSQFPLQSHHLKESNRMTIPIDCEWLVPVVHDLISFSSTIQILPILQSIRTQGKKPADYAKRAHCFHSSLSKCSSIFNFPSWFSLFIEGDTSLISLHNSSLFPLPVSLLFLPFFTPAYRNKSISLSHGHCTLFVPIDRLNDVTRQRSKTNRK